ncbi:MAG: YqaJ viral recombinase family protein [Carnobacterium maltaromaticum]|jgi:putative phage-type endonuclease|nr:YqaJ viral recombinase family protein [Carnobacterium maltaromaticum]MCI1819859.1 YqaJ viral recombinase family protein [Carnobacterium maltaromaticum]
MTNLFGLETTDTNVTENRNVFVGGSDIPAILGISKYKTQFELAKEKAGISTAEFQSNPYIQYGNKMEPAIREYINTMNSLNFQPETFIDKNNGIRSNVDGFDKETGLLLEIKTHGATPTIKVYEAQMQLYMAQMGIDVGWLALYKRPGDFDLEFDRENLEIKEVERDNDYIQKIVDAIESFWIRVYALKDNPEMTEVEFSSYGNDLEKMAKRVEVFEMEILNFKEQAKLVEARQKELKEELYSKMEENDIKKFETELLTITRVLPTTSKTIDSAKLKKENPDLFETYSKVSNKKGYVKITAKKNKEETNK